MAKVYRLGDHRPFVYEVRYRTPAGASRRKRFDRMADANAFASNMEQAKRAGAYVDLKAGRQTVGDWWHEWWPTAPLRSSTRARDESYWRNHVEPTFGDTPLRNVTHLGVQRWAVLLADKGLAPATVQKATQILSKTMRSAVRAGKLASNPVDGIELPRIDTGEMRCLNEREIARLADTIDDRYADWVWTAAYTGLRAGELAGLRVRRIDWTRRGLLVAENVVEVAGRLETGQPKTRAGQRFVPAPGLVMAALERRCEHLAADGYVFTGPEGGPLRTNLFRRRFFDPAVTAAGLDPLRPHDLRHTAVSLWIAHGANAKEVAEWAGHRSVATVYDRYGHLFPGQERRVMDVLDAAAAAAR